MRVRSVALSSICGMLMACTTVYYVTDPTPLSARGLAAGPAPIDPPETAPALAIEARAGHSALHEGGRTFVLLEASARRGAVVERPRPRTLLVIDRSGSMSGRRIDEARAAAERWVSEAPAGDVIGVAAFDGRSELLVPPIALDDETRIRLSRAIRGIVPSGDTCISCGLDEAKRALGTSDDMGRIVLLTDGEATTGVTDVQGLRTLAAGYGERGLGITTIGLGIGYNEAALSAIALASNAHHHFVGSPSDLAMVFDRERQALAKTTVAGADAEIELGAGVELVDVVARDFRREAGRVVVPLGAFTAGDRKTVLVEVKMGPLAGGERPLASVRVRYRDVARERKISLEQALRVTVGGEQSEMDPVVFLRIERDANAKMFERASQLFEAGDRAGALVGLTERRVALVSAMKRATARAEATGEPRAAEVHTGFAEQIESLDQARAELERARPRTDTGRAATKSVRARHFMPAML